MLLARLTPLVLLLALAGCGSFGAISMPSFKKTAEVAPEPIQPAPASPVESQALPPADGSIPEGQVAEALPNGVDAPSPPVSDSQPVAAPAAGALGRTDLLGGWTIASSGDSCQLFMTLTSWTGGYRASTRGCTSDMLKSISAWSLDGKQVVLAGSGGSPVARLYSAGGNRFDGQTEGLGTPVSFYR